MHRVIFQGGFSDLSLSEKLHSRTRKMSQLMKCLPHKHKDLVQIPSTHIKKLDQKLWIHSPYAKRRTGEESGNPSLAYWSDSLTQSNGWISCSVKSWWGVIHAWTTVLHTHWHTPTHTHINTYIIGVQGVTNTPYNHCKIHFNLLDTVELNLSGHWGNIKLTKHILKNQKPNSWVKQHQNVGKCWQWVILFTIDPRNKILQVHLPHL